MTKLDRDILLQTLAGYAEVNKITEAERRARLKTMTDAAAREIFASLYETWKQSGKRAAGDWEALARHRIEHHLRVRQALEVLAKNTGLT